MVGRRVAILVAILSLLSARQAVASGEEAAASFGTSFFTLTPCRLEDTRGPLGGPALAAGEERVFTATGHCAIPPQALALAVNLTVVSPASGGFATLFAGDAPAAPGTTTLNFSSGQIRANNAIVQLASDGSGTIALQNFSGGNANYVIDVFGYFACGITISPTGPALPPGTEGTKYGQTFTASGGTGSYSFAITSGSLPAGLALLDGGVLLGTPMAAGDFSFTVTATDTVTGCAGSRAYTLHINCPTLTVAITPTPAQVCSGSTGNSASATAGFATYSWTITNGTITSAADIQTITYTAGASGNVGLTVNVTDAAGCPGQATRNVPIGANQAPPSIATSNPQTFTVSGGAGSFTLTFSGQTTSSLAFNATAAQVQFALNALSSIGLVGGSVTVTQAGGVYTVTFGGTLTGPQPQMTATGAGGCTVFVSAPAVCAGSTGNQASGPAGAATYAWTIENGTITSAANIQTITYTAGVSGNVTLNLTVTNPGVCAASNSVDVTINPSPAPPTITPTPAQVCGGSTGNQASGPAGATSYAWSITNGTITSATDIQTITYTAGASGNVGLTLVVTNASNCSATNTVNVPINASPGTPPITPTPAQVCANSTGNQASGPAGATSYAWTIANGTITSATNIQTITYTAGASGSVTLNLTVTNAAACAASNSVLVPINANPAPPTITNSGPQMVTVTGGAGNFTLTFNGQTTASLAFNATAAQVQAALNALSSIGGVGGSVTVNLAGGVYSVLFGGSLTGPQPLLTASGAGGATVAVSPTACADSTGNQASGPAGATTYAWTIGNGTITSATDIQTITYTAGSSGTVTLNLTVTNAASCSASNSLLVTINPTPAAPTITPTPASVCALSTGNTADGPAGMASYAWTITNGTITSATNIQTITYTAGASGSVTLNLTVTNASNCSASNSLDVPINPAPATPTITPSPAQVCAGSTGNTASGPAGATTYAWSITNGTITSATNIQTITYTAGVAAGNVGLTLTVTNAQGCATSNTVNVTKNPTPAFTPAPGVLSVATYNVAYSLTFTGTGGTAPYTFVLASGALPTGLTLNSNGTVSPNTPSNTGPFAFSITVTDAKGCSSTQAYTLNVQPNLTAKAYTDVGNTQLVGGVAAPATPSVSVVPVSNGDTSDVAITYAVTVAPTHGTLTTFNTNGTFLYTPNAGNTTSDAFTYTGTSNGVAATQTATIAFSGMVWYVDNATGSGTNDGRSNTPFKTMTAVNGAATTNGDFIYVAKGSGTTTGAYTMKPSQKLIGAGATLNVPTVSPILTVAGSAANTPTIGGTITLANSVTVDGIDMSTGSSRSITNFNGVSYNTVTGVTVTARTVASSTATAIDIQGAGNTGTMTFTSVSASGAPSGIIVSNFTGGSFTVSGTGSAASGGTILNSTGDGVVLTNVNSPSLNWMNVTDSAGGATDDGLVLTNIPGTVTIANCTIANSPHNGITVDNNNTNMAGFNLTNTTVSCASGQPCEPSGSIGNDGLLLVMRGTSVLTSGTISGSTFSGVRATGVQVTANDSGRIGANSRGSITASIVVQNNTFTGNGQGIDIDSSQVSSVTFQVVTNTIVGKLTAPGAISNQASSTAINAFTAAGADTGPTSHSFVGEIDGNTIGTQGVKDSGSGFGSGIRVVIQGQTTQGIVTVSNNTIREVPNAAILNFFGQNGAAASGSNSAHFKIINNTMPAPSGSNLSLCGPVNTPCGDTGIFVLADEGTPVCNIITGNSVFDVTTIGGSFDVYLAERAGPPAGAQLTVEGTGGSNSAYIQANNTLTGGSKFIDEGANTSQVAPSACGTFP